jgi:hypothetical protein
MSGLREAAAPRSDQLNSDDLIAGSIIIKIRKVNVVGGGQDIKAHIFYEGDNDKPWKPCKSMIRVLIDQWGDNENGTDYLGRSVQLFRDPSTAFKGMTVGGIRISHLSHIERDTTVLLTVKRGQKIDYPVKVLRVAETEKLRTMLEPETLELWTAEIANAKTMADLQATNARIKTNNYDEAGLTALRAFYNDAQERIRTDVSPKDLEYPPDEGAEGAEVIPDL